MPQSMHVLIWNDKLKVRGASADAAGVANVKAPVGQKRAHRPHAEHELLMTTSANGTCVAGTSVCSPRGGTCRSRSRSRRREPGTLCGNLASTGPRVRRSGGGAISRPRWTAPSTRRRIDENRPRRDIDGRWDSTTAWVESVAIRSSTAPGRPTNETVALPSGISASMVSTMAMAPSAAVPIGQASHHDMSSSTRRVPSPVRPNSCSADREARHRPWRTGCRSRSRAADRTAWRRDPRDRDRRARRR